MKYIVLTFVFVFLYACVSSQDAGVGTTLSDGSVINYIDINKKKQGKWMKKYENGAVRYEGAFVNDLPVGIFKYYYSNGNLKSYLVYRDDHTSTVDMYWENGTRAANGEYDTDNKRHKEWKLYFEDGKLSAIISYIHGKADGNVKMYYPESGNIVLDCNYLQGELNGYYKKFFDNGKLQEEGPYKTRAKHGHWKLYAPSGMLEEEGEYVEGFREGQWKDYRKKSEGEIVTYKKGTSDRDLEEMKQWREKQEWAKENQDKFMHPEDYLDNPMEYFKKNSDVDYGKSKTTEE